jgi:hypothetical protein
MKILHLIRKNLKTRQIYVFSVVAIVLTLIMLDFANGLLFNKIKLELRLQKFIKLFKTNHRPKPTLVGESMVSKKHEASSCSVYNHDAQQFYVNINGVQYPQHVPIYYNRTINFDCLNTMRRRNRILLWNPFFDDKSHGYGI